MVEQTAPSGRLRLVVVSIDRLDPGRAIVSDADTVFLEKDEQWHAEGSYVSGRRFLAIAIYLI